ncbi:MAG: sugar nucleotide-binding protein [Aquisalinus sp.]|nr:sugar nucleotide-binding protein [Aquisalinus sp.]
MIKNDLASANIALVGHTGFVGSSLKRQYKGFESTYNSANISDISGKEYDLLVCAAAPATMWLANNDPAQDRQNLLNLVTCLERVKCDRIVLISTIAVLDDFAGQYSEENARFEPTKAYGKHRRELEEKVQSAFAGVHILRLPALFGFGLKKNFIFDLLNPAPAFLKDDKAEELRAQMSQADLELFKKAYGYDDAIAMLKLDRSVYCESDFKELLDGIFQRAGFTAKMFTNSESTFQYYNMNNLWFDISRAVTENLDVVHICSEPLKAGDIHERLMGQSFYNTAPAKHQEDMRSIHVKLWGGEGQYLYSADSIMADIETFYYSMN